MADSEHNPNNPFIVLLTGDYQAVPMGGGPADNLGLDPTVVNLSDGTYSKTKIYPIYGVDGANDQKKAIGTFFVSLKTGLCAYDLPGGSLLMQFLAAPLVPFSDGNGGQFDEGTAELTIIGATGIYAAFNGGHNHMVDKLHQLVAGPLSPGSLRLVTTSSVSATSVSIRSLRHHEEALAASLDISPESAREQLPTQWIFNRSKIVAGQCDFRFH